MINGLINGLVAEANRNTATRSQRWQEEATGKGPGPYQMGSQNCNKRDRWLPRYLSIHNGLKEHTALSGRSSQQALNELLC